MKYSTLTLLFLLTACATSTTHTSQTPNNPEEKTQKDNPRSLAKKPTHIPFPYLIDRKTFTHLVHQPRDDNTIKPFHIHTPLQPPHTPESILNILEPPDPSPPPSSPPASSP